MSSSSSTHWSKEKAHMHIERIRLIIYVCFVFISIIWLLLLLSYPLIFYIPKADRIKSKKLKNWTINDGIIHFATDCRFASYSLNLFLYQNYFLLISHRGKIAFSDFCGGEGSEKGETERISWLVWNFIHAIDTHAHTTNAVMYIFMPFVIHVCCVEAILHFLQLTVDALCMLASQSHRMNDLVLWLLLNCVRILSFAFPSPLFVWFMFRLF